jgi:hypothetical protein
MSQAVQEILNYLTPEDRTYMLPKMLVTNYQPTLHNILEEQRSRLHRGGSLKSHSEIIFVLLYLLCKFVRVCVTGFMGLQVCERVCYWVYGFASL